MLRALQARLRLRATEATNCLVLARVGVAGVTGGMDQFRWFETLQYWVG